MEARALDETTTQGVVARRLDTLTDSTAAPSASFHHLARSLNSSWGRKGGKVDGQHIMNEGASSHWLYIRTQDEATKARK
jgi:hypothetical protein